MLVNSGGETLSHPVTETSVDPYDNLFFPYTPIRGADISWCFNADSSSTTDATSEDPHAVVPYPEHVVMKYPKPGYANPLVQVHVFRLDRYLASTRQAGAGSSTSSLLAPGSGQGPPGRAHGQDGDRGSCARGRSLLKATFSPRRAASRALSPVSRPEHRPQALPSSGSRPKAIAFEQVGGRDSREQHSANTPHPRSTSERIEWRWAGEGRAWCGAAWKVFCLRGLARDHILALAHLATTAFPSSTRCLYCVNREAPKGGYHGIEG